MPIMPARGDPLGPSQPRSWRPSLRSRRTAADPTPARLTTAQARCGSLKTPLGASSDCPNRDRLKNASHGGGVTQSQRSRSRARDPSDPKLATSTMCPQQGAASVRSGGARSPLPARCRSGRLHAQDARRRRRAGPGDLCCLSIKLARLARLVSLEGAAPRIGNSIPSDSHIRVWALIRMAPSGARAASWLQSVQPPPISDCASAGPITRS
jgi:hypothetical protein